MSSSNMSDRFRGGKAVTEEERQRDKRETRAGLSGEREAEMRKVHLLIVLERISV